MSLRCILVVLVITCLPVMLLRERILIMFAIVLMNIYMYRRLGDDYPLGADSYTLVVPWINLEKKLNSMSIQ